MVRSDKIYSPQSYLERITGNCYTITGDDDVAFVERVLEERGYCLWSYPLSEIDHIVAEGLEVVLVDCMVYNEESKEYEHEYRWFEVDDVSEEDTSGTSDSNEEEVDGKTGSTSKYFFDVKVTTVQTIAIEASSLEQAYRRVDSAYSRQEFVIDRATPDYVNFDYAQKRVEECIAMGFYSADELETFNCSDVVFDKSMKAYVCPVCGEYIADKSSIKDLDCKLPTHCDQCGAKLRY